MPLVFSFETEKKTILNETHNIEFSFVNEAICMQVIFQNIHENRKIVDFDCLNKLCKYRFPFFFF